jgi:hypothetical protein
MRGLNLTKPSRLTSNGYFSMIGDALIIPSKRATQLDEFYFKARAEKIVGKDSTKVAAKKLLEDKSSGVFFEPLWKDTLATDNLTSRVATAVSMAMEFLKKAKDDRQGAIDELGRKATITMKTARERVDAAIERGSLDDGISSETAKKLVTSAMSNIEKYVYYWTVADAYTSEIERRATNEILIKRAIIKGDVKELKSLRSNAVVTELKDQIDEAIKSIEQAKKDEANRTEEERKAKALADAEAKALAEAIKKAEAELAAAKTDEEKAAAQAKLQGLKNSGSNGAGTGLPKMAIYGGIALVVAIGAYFMFRKKD